MQIAFLGLGQIGGSMARALALSATRISAWTPAGGGPSRASGDGVVAAATAADAIRGADVIVLAAPPLACLDLLDDLVGPLAEARPADSVITDVASTKATIVGRARANGLRFVGGHPMAGRETAGYEAADPELFRDRPWVLVHADPPDAAADARIAELVRACGARPTWIDAETHDSAVAAISHAPLVLAAALVEATAGATDWDTARSLVAGGWASMTRLAGGDPAMGAGILATNRRPTAARLRAIRDVLDEWIALVAGGSEDAVGLDAQAIHDRLASARARLDQ